MVSVTKAGLNGITMGTPSKILQQLNRIVKRVNFGRLRMSLSVAKLNKDSVELSSAAMPPTGTKTSAPQAASTSAAHQGTVQHQKTAPQNESPDALQNKDSTASGRPDGGSQHAVGNG